MPISPINTHAKVKPADIPLEKLATSKTLTEQEKTSEMTRQFEAVLVRQILTEAQKPVFQSNLTPKGVDSSIYQDMMVNQLAENITSSRTVGLAQQLESQFSRQAGGQKAPVHAHAPAALHSQNKSAPQPPIPLTKSPRL